MREVYRDMVTLNDPLLEVEGRHATDAELLLYHTPAYLKRVRDWVEDAERKGGPMEIQPGLVVSGASWDASVAAVGCALVAVDTILDRRARNAFCPARPPGRDAAPDEPGRHGFLNPCAIVIRDLLRRNGIDRVLAVVWGDGDLALPAREGVEGVRSVTIAPGRRTAGTADDLAGSGGVSGIREAGDGDRALEAALEGFRPDFIVLSADFDADARSGSEPLAPEDFYLATLRLRELADELCEGRLVSVLDGGYDSALLGPAAVQHLRALAGIPSA
jgi:acetoin utilization deacetylase AcuC-like enzyme